MLISPINFYTVMHSLFNWLNEKDWNFEQSLSLVASGAVKLEIDHAFFSFYISIWNFTPFFWNIWFYMIYQVRGNYYVGIHSSGAGSRWRRTTGQEIYSPLLLAFTHEVWVWLNSRYLHHGLIVITMLNLVTFLLIRTWKIGSRLIWLKELSWIQITPSLLMLLW